MINVSEQINSVQRVVGSAVLDAGEAHVVTISQNYDATIDDVWDACTNPDRIPRWFLPISGELRVGGQYQFEGNAGGTVERCDAPNSFGGNLGVRRGRQLDRGAARSHPDGGTLFTLEHTGSVGDDEMGRIRPGRGRCRLGWDGAGPRAALRWRLPGTGGGDGLDDVRRGPGVHDAQQPALAGRQHRRRHRSGRGHGRRRRTTAAYTAVPS